jgi:hypothetical protein
MYVCMYVCMRVCICMYIYIHTYTHTYIHTYTHTYIHTYTHTLMDIILSADSLTTTLSQQSNRKVLSMHRIQNRTNSTNEKPEYMHQNIPARTHECQSSKKLKCIASPNTLTNVLNTSAILTCGFTVLRNRNEMCIIYHAYYY